MSPAIVTFFTIMLILFAFYGFVSFLADINRSFKKKAKEPIKKKGGNRNENEDIELP